MFGFSKTDKKDTNSDAGSSQKIMSDDIDIAVRNNNYFVVDLISLVNNSTVQKQVGYAENMKFGR